LKRGELIVAALFILVAAVVIGDTVRIGSGWTEYGPDAGFVPFWLGVLLMVSAFIILISGLREKGGDNFFNGREGLWEVVRIAFTSILLTIGIIFLGVYFSTFLYSILFARWLGKHRWTSCIVFAVIITLVIFFGMEKGLRITLPKSPLYEKNLFIF
jgi:hypothetical protein